MAQRTADATPTETESPDAADLTDVPGIGPKTAASIREAGYETVRDLYIAYLGTEAETVASLVPRVDDLAAHRRNVPVRGADLGITRHANSLAASAFMGFIREFGLSHACIDGAVDLGETESVSPEMVDWCDEGEPDQLMNAGSTATIFETENADEVWTSEYHAPLAEPTEIVPFARDDAEGVAFNHGEVENVIDAALLEGVNRVYGRDYAERPELVRVNTAWTVFEDGARFNDEGPDRNGSPVQFRDPESGTTIMVAPRIVDYDD